MTHTAPSAGRFQARLVVTADIVARSGLHIGGTLPGLAIGGVDLPVIRDPITSRPYIPGSSLRGKMRSLLDHWYGNDANHALGAYVRIHMPVDTAGYDDSPVARLFGILASREIATLRPTRLLVRDVAMPDDEARRLLDAARGGLLYTEGKTEAAIDRLTSAASPRTVERVLANTRFAPFSALITLYDDDDPVEYLSVLLRGMRLLEDDYLGGHGARGSGEIAFERIGVRVRLPRDYQFPFGEGATVAAGESLFDPALNSRTVGESLRSIVARG